MNHKRIWLTWEKQRRNRSMSREVGAELFELLSSRGRLARYIELVFRSISIIRTREPEVVFCQNPSIVLSLLVVLLKPLVGYCAVVDEHNAGLYPNEGRSKILNRFARLIVRRADLVIVSNAALASQCERWNGSAVVVPDPLPIFEEDVRSLRNDSETTTTPPERAFRIVFICTWADDEPYLNVIEAAARFDAELMQVRITGDPKGRIGNRSLPANVTVTGFLPDQDYVEEIAKADGVIVLTNRDNCLNCGAYEAVSLGRPGVLSDSPALRAYFSRGFCFSNSDVDGIADSLTEFMAKFDSLFMEVKELRAQLTVDSSSLDKLERALALV